MSLYEMFQALFMATMLIGFTFLFVWIITRYYLKGFYPLLVKKENNKTDFKDRISVYIFFSMLIMVGFILNILNFQNWI